MNIFKSDLVRIIAPADFPKDEKGGAVVSVIIPNKWILWVSTEHPAWVDLFNMEIQSWDKKALKDFIAIPTCPHIAREYAKIELEKRK